MLQVAGVPFTEYQIIKARDAGISRGTTATPNRTWELSLWRTCFLRAVACTLRPWRVQLTDADLLELRGVRFLDMSGSLNVTDTGFAHLAGIPKPLVPCGG